MKINYRNWVALVMTIILTLGSAGCTETDTDSGERTTVTMMYMIDLPTFKELIESTYPDIELQIERNTEATIDGETQRRLRNGHGTDIITSTMASITMMDQVLDLSAEDYITNYQYGLIHDIMSGNGKTMFIPLPGQYFGYIYNVTLAEQAGISEPETPSDIMKMLETAYAKGIGVGEDGTLFGLPSTMTTISTYLLGTQVPDFLGQADGILWTDEMRKRASTFSGHLENCIDMPLEMVEKGYLNPMSLFGVCNATPIYERMRDGTMLMGFGNVHLLNMLNQSKTYTYSMLPFQSEKGNHAWTIAAPDAYLALNASLAAPENAATLDAANRVLRLLSTEEGQRAFIKDIGAAQSYLADISIDKEILPKGIEECITNGYVYNIRIPFELLRYFGSRLSAVLNGKTDINTALEEVDKFYLEDSQIENDTHTLIGLCEKDMIFANYNVRQQETELANFIADAVAEVTGADMAFINGGSIRGSLYAGSIYSYDLNAVCPYPNKFVLLEVNAATIRSMLENGLTELKRANNIPGGRFLNVSGLRYSFRASDKSGKAKLLEVTLPDGSPLDENRTYTIAVTDYMAGSSGYLDGNGDGFTMINVYSDTSPLAANVSLKEETGYTLTDILKQYIQAHNTETIGAELDGRIKVVGSDE